jgi:hypothetical protein
MTKRNWGGAPSHDGCQPLSCRAKVDAAPGWASSSSRWGFTTPRWFPRLSSCGGADFRLTSVGLLLLQAQWQWWWWLLSCRSISTLGRESWTVEKASSLCGRMHWRVPSAPLGGCAWNATPSASMPRLPNRTTMPRHAPLVPCLNTPSTLTGC